MQKKEKREYIFYLLWGVEFTLGICVRLCRNALDYVEMR